MPDDGTEGVAEHYGEKHKIFAKGGHGPMTPKYATDYNCIKQSIIIPLNIDIVKLTNPLLLLFMFNLKKKLCIQHGV